MIWERLFSARVLARGYDYWCDNAVRIVSREAGAVNAIVVGSEDYETEIYLDGKGAVTEMRCSCPHALDGNNCKHMAAVLYELGGYAGPADEQDDDLGADRPSLQAIVESMTVEHLRAELVRVASADPLLAAQLVARYPPKADGEDIDTTNNGWDDYIRTMKARISQLIHNNSDHGFVDWRQGSWLMQAFDREVFADLLEIIEFGKETEVPFELSMYLLEEFSEVDMDGSGGEHGEFEESMTALWEEIHGQAGEGQRNAMFATLLEYYEAATDQQWFFADMVWSFMQDHFDSRVLNERKLAVVDAELKKFDLPGMAAAKHAASSKQKKLPVGFRSGTSRTNEFTVSRLVLERIDLMEKLGFAQSDIIAFRDGARFLHEVRELEMQELESDGRYDALAALLKESKELDADYAGLVVQYSDRLITCYEKLEQHDHAREEAYAYVVRYSPGSLKGFIRLKSFYSAEEWTKERENVFKQLHKRSRNLNALYKEEGLYDRIMAAIEQQLSGRLMNATFLLQEIARYENELKPAYEGKLLDIHRQAVVAMARPTSGRAGYQEIVRMLRRMLDYEGGEACVRALLDEWRTRYSNRPAMQDELSRVFIRHGRSI